MAASLEEATLDFLHPVNLEELQQWGSKQADGEKYQNWKLDPAFISDQDWISLKTQSPNTYGFLSLRFPVKYKEEAHFEGDFVNIVIYMLRNGVKNCMATFPFAKMEKVGYVQVMIKYMQNISPQQRTAIHYFKDDQKMTKVQNLDTTLQELFDCGDQTLGVPWHGAKERGHTFCQTTLRRLYKQAIEWFPSNSSLASSADIYGVQSESDPPSISSEVISQPSTKASMYALVLEILEDEDEIEEDKSFKQYESLARNEDYNLNSGEGTAKCEEQVDQCMEKMYSDMRGIAFMRIEELENQRIKKLEELKRRESQIQAHEEECNKREETLQENEKALNRRQEKCDEKETALAQREEEIDEKDRKNNQAFEAREKKIQDDIDKHNAVVEEVTEFNCKKGKRVKLSVGGTEFQTTRATLMKEGNSRLATMFENMKELECEEDGSYFIDRDGTHFGLILNYLRDLDHDSVPDLPDLSRVEIQKLGKEAKYYKLHDLTKHLQEALSRAVFDT